MKRQKRHLEIARATALASPGAGGKKGRFRLGAVITKKKRVLAAKFNSLKTHPSLLPFYQYPHLHAEAAAILSLGIENCYDTTMYIVRVRRDKSLALAKPCSECRKLIEHVGIKQVIYSTSKGFKEL